MSKKKILELGERDIVTLHHGLGQWIRNNWDYGKEKDFSSGSMKRVFLILTTCPVSS